MHWLQRDDDGNISLGELQLDIVGFLAILGEGSVLANAQVSTLTKWVFVPRLIPAPQALMRPTRPNCLEPFPGSVTGILSGNHRDNINHIGNIVWYVRPFASRGITRTLLHTCTNLHNTPGATRIG
jgi:hypothetical protein